MHAARLARSAATGLAGVAPHPAARDHLRRVYAETLATLRAMPAHAAYRQAATAITEQRLRVVAEARDDAAVAHALHVPRIELVIADAEAEQALAARVAEWRAWEAPRP